MKISKIPCSYDVIGSIGILKFSDMQIKASEKKKIAEKLLKERKNIKTVLEKTEKVSGRLRKIKTKWLAGEKTTETIHRESGCLFKLDINKTYFSPRLSNERLEAANKIKKIKKINNKKVLVMFAGVAPYSIIIAKIAKPKQVVSIELNKKACQYARENILLNKLENIKIIQGDVKKIIPKLKAKREKYAVIVMPRPQIRETFLKEAFSVSKKGTEIFYYDFGREPGKILEKIYQESKKARKKISIERVKKAGEIAPFKYRWRIDLRVIS